MDTKLIDTKPFVSAFLMRQQHHKLVSPFFNIKVFSSNINSDKKRIVVNALLENIHFRKLFKQLCI